MKCKQYLSVFLAGLVTSTSLNTNVFAQSQEDIETLSIFNEINISSLEENEDIVLDEIDDTNVETEDTELILMDDDVKISESRIIEDGSYVADISVLHETLEQDSSAAKYFKTTEAPIKVEDGKIKLRLVYSNSMIEEISQNNEGNFEKLDVVTDGESKYVDVVFNNIDDVENVQIKINTGSMMGIMTHVIRVSIKSDTLVEIKEEIPEEVKLEDGIYSVPVSMLQVSNPDNYSHGNSAIDGNATVTIIDGKSYIELKFKAITSMGIYGHILNIWSFTGTEFDASKWNNGEIEATKVQEYEDYGINYTSGDLTKESFPSIFRIDRDSTQEDSFIIRMSVDAMDGYDQPAILKFDYSKAEKIDNPAVKFSSMPVITPSLTRANNNTEISVELNCETEMAKIYYTTDGTVPTENSMLYTDIFKVTGINTTIIIKAIAVTEGMQNSAVVSQNIVFVQTNSGGDDNNTEDNIDVNQDGKYWIPVSLYNASIDQESMGNTAFMNNKNALITTENGVSKIEIATNPVEISGYISGLKEMQYSNNGVYESVTVLQTSSISTGTKYDGTNHTFNYISKFEFTLENTSNKYVNVKINVPYTPMEGATASNGYMSARLMLDWDSITKASNSDSITPDTSSSSGSSSGGGSSNTVSSNSFDATDKTTGIRIVADKNVVLNGSELVAEELSSGEQYELVRGAVSEDVNKFKAYSIYIKKDNVNVSLQDKVKIYLPIDENYDKEILAVYRISTDGIKTLISGVIEEDNYVIETNTLGLFSLCELTDVEVEDNIATVQDVVKNEFSDILGHWGEEAINFVVSRNLFMGISETEFAPNAKMTRGMFVTVLARLENIDSNNYTSKIFSDVNGEEYYFSSVAWAYENNIVSGISNNEFAPNAFITREQLCVLLSKYITYKGIELETYDNIQFKDEASINNWAKDAVNSLSTVGLISGKEDGYFDPKSGATRAEVASIFMRLINKGNL